MPSTLIYTETLAVQKSINLEPFPPADLTDQISTLLDAIFPARQDPTLTSHLTREPIRQVDGIQQILYTESRCVLL